MCIRDRVSTVHSAGPVILYNSQFLFQPVNLPDADAQQVQTVLQTAANSGGTKAEECKQLVARITEEIGAIQRGEAAANSRLEAAMDLLKPQHDYYEY